MTNAPHPEFAKAVVELLSDEEMKSYGQTPDQCDQYLFADELCSRHDFHNSEANVEVFETALDNRARKQWLLINGGF